MKKHLQNILILYIIDNRKNEWIRMERGTTGQSLYFPSKNQAEKTGIHSPFKTPFTHYNQFIFFTQVK